MSPEPRMRPATRSASNTSSGVELLAGAQVLDRQPGDVGAWRAPAAAPAIAVSAGQHHAGQGQAIVEGLGGPHRVLAGQGVGDQQDLVRGGDAGDLCRLAHHLLVQRGAPGGVQDQHVEAAEPGRGQPPGG